MRNDLMFLKESAVDLLADVAAGQVGADGRNDRTGRACSSSISSLAAYGAVRRADRVGRSRRLYELTDEGREALAWHRPGAAASVTRPYSPEGGAGQ